MSTALRLYSLFSTASEEQSVPFAPNLEAGEVLGLVLGGCERGTNMLPLPHVRTMILIVQNKGSHLERVGHTHCKRENITFDKASEQERSKEDVHAYWRAVRELILAEKRRRTIRLG